MEANQFVGLVKFFRDENYLDKLISGCFYCKTPENYRLDNLEGVSDKYESCTYSYRTVRCDEPITMHMAGFELEGLIEATIHKGEDFDSWLHCWMSLRVPKDELALSQLKDDVRRLKKEFGENYAFIPADKLAGFVSLLIVESEHKMWCNEVIYSLDRAQWSPECKALEYSYQREYRFGFGRCAVNETNTYILNCSSGFGEYIIKNQELKLSSDDGKRVWFDLQAV